MKCYNFDVRGTIVAVMIGLRFGFLLGRRTFTLHVARHWSRCRALGF